ncbi:tyrosine-type recombinase/integrase [Spongiibacter sp.]|mgnify:CR=1 FL=1|uniref:tyrosine-type recombinase/integrase n=1 Tax=Spongiibacter sp. TaxID=2024860 RepID=UPI000C6B6F91|nr:tyrosine-type recombinase/integrase [Spongiibacter sp.]MAY39123.1 integrase [Spongiibacter sp.]MBI58252.1 integrase [Spongiibacter sp.]|tara:strand:+ start:790 stop:1914 length:1125 start_codon:yes stop_codon:yes gene_type:complete
MGRNKSPGLTLRGGVWHVDKVVYGQRIRESTGTSNLEEAEAFLAHRINSCRQSKIYGVRPEWKFRDAAAKYLQDNMDRQGISKDASRIKVLLPFIADVPLRYLHDGTLQGYVNDCRARGLKSKTINNGLEMVRRILNQAARRWRDENGLTWLEVPPLITMLPSHDSRSPYPLDWEEQRMLLHKLPDHLAAMTLFKVNSGTREQEVCRLRWDWEIAVPELNTSVFLIPGDYVKNREDRLVVLNRIARSIIEAQRGKHPTHVFTFRGRPIGGMRNSAWKRARAEAAKAHAEKLGQPVAWGFENLRVHDLKHTFGRRLRAAGVPLETRKVLLGHRNGDITAHYCAPEIEELLSAANRVCGDECHKTPTLTLLKRKTA